MIRLARRHRLGRLRRARSAVSTANQAPLLYFVHVPKTAGSTLNAYLTRFSVNGYDHCEAVLGQPEEWARRFRHADWMSAHTSLDVVLDRAQQGGERPVRLFTCVREPTAQLMSHYNWLIEIHHRGGAFYEAHAQDAKDISEFIRSTDHDAQGVEAALRRYPGLFRNAQARVVLGEGTWTRSAMAERLRHYEAAVPHEQVGALFETMTGHPPPELLRSNRSEYHFDRAVFRDPGLQLFLRDYNAQDYELWDVVATAAAGRETGAPRQV